MSELSMIGEPRLKPVPERGSPRKRGHATFVHCCALRCREQPLGVVNLYRQVTQYSGPQGDGETIITGAVLLLRRRFDNWRDPDIWEFNPRPSWKRTHIKRINQDKDSKESFGTVLDSQELLGSEEARNSIRDGQSVLIVGLDNQTGWHNKPNGTLPIKVRCPRCKRLTRLTRENLKPAIDALKLQAPERVG